MVRQHTGKTSSSLDSWLQLAVRALARSDRSTAQIETQLVAKGATSWQVRRTIRRLTLLRYLDDSAFAERWVDRRLARMPMGRARLEDELRATGCPESILQARLHITYRGEREQELARQVVVLAGAPSLNDARVRLARRLSQRGFDDDTIETVMAPLLREKN